MSIEGEREEAYSAFTIIDSIGVDDGVQKGTLKEVWIICVVVAEKRVRNLPQYEDLGGHQKSCFSKSRAEKKVRYENFSLTKAYKPLLRR